MIDNSKRHTYPYRCKIKGLASWVYLSDLPDDAAHFDLAMFHNDKKLRFHTPSQSGKGGFGMITKIEKNPHYKEGK